MSVNPIKFAKSLYYANTSRVTRKIESRPFRATDFMPKQTTPETPNQCAFCNFIKKAFENITK